MTKTCSKCGVEKNRTVFAKDRTRYDGLHPQCKECRDVSRRAYYAKNRDEILVYARQWKEENKAHRAETGKRYYAANIEARKAYRAEWAARNKERVQAVNKAWYEANRERANERNRSYHAMNRDKENARKLLWAKVNREQHNERCARRRAAKMQAHVDWADEFIIAEAYDLAKRRTQSTGIPWHVDHIVPLKSKIVCGLHCHFNMQVIPGVVNISKSNRHWPGMPV